GRAVSAGAGHRSGLGATGASGLRRSGPPEWTWSDRGERSPPERATGVDLERPGRAVSAGAGHRSGLGATGASGLRRSGPPEWTWSDRGERSPPERATGVDLERPLLTIRWSMLPDLIVRCKETKP